MHTQSLSCPTLCDPMDCSPQTPLSTGFSRQECWSGSSFPPPGDLPNPNIELMSPASPALAGGFFATEPPGKLKGDPRTLCKEGQPWEIKAQKRWQAGERERIRIETVVAAHVGTPRRGAAWAAGGGPFRSQSQAVSN